MVSFQACGQTISYSGQTDLRRPGGQSTRFSLPAKRLTVRLDAEAYFANIGVYTGHYTPPYYPPGGGGGPMTLWIP